MSNVPSHNKLILQLKQALVQSISTEDIHAIVQALVAEAKEGNLQAAKLLFQYVFGKPAAGISPEEPPRERTSSKPKTFPNLDPGTVPALTGEMLREIARSEEWDKRPQTRQGNKRHTASPSTNGFSENQSSTSKVDLRQVEAGKNIQIVPPTDDELSS